MFLVPFSQLFRCQHNLRKLINNPLDENYPLRRIVSYHFLIWFVNSLRIKNSLPPLTLVACAAMWSRWYVLMDLYRSRCWWWYLLIYIHVSIIMISKCYHCLWVSMPAPHLPNLLFASCCLYLHSNLIEESKEGRNPPYIRQILETKLLWVNSTK